MNKLIPQHVRDNPQQYIPHGHYCYKWIEGNKDRKYRVCPFWDKDHSQPHQENGYCHYLKEGDWMNEGFGLLWDQVKECGVNDDLEE